MRLAKNQFKHVDECLFRGIRFYQFIKSAIEFVIHLNFVDVSLYKT